MYICHRSPWLFSFQKHGSRSVRSGSFFWAVIYECDPDQYWGGGLAPMKIVTSLCQEGAPVKRDESPTESFHVTMLSWLLPLRLLRTVVVVSIAAGLIEGSVLCGVAASEPILHPVAELIGVNQHSIHEKEPFVGPEFGSEAMRTGLSSGRPHHLNYQKIQIEREKLIFFDSRWLKMSNGVWTCVQGFPVSYFGGDVGWFGRKLRAQIYEGVSRSYQAGQGAVVFYYPGDFERGGFDVINWMFSVKDRQPRRGVYPIGCCKNTSAELDGREVSNEYSPGKTLLDNGLLVGFRGLGLGSRSLNSKLVERTSYIDSANDADHQSSTRNIYGDPSSVSLALRLICLLGGGIGHGFSIFWSWRSSQRAQFRGVLVGALCAAPFAALAFFAVMWP